MKKITLIFLALAVVINSFSVANVQSEAAENDIENEVHTEILEQSGNEWNNQENQKNSSDFSDSDTIQDNSDINATENGVDAEKQDDTKVEDPQNMDDPELTDRANSWRYTDGVLFHQEEIGGKARSRAKAAYNPNATRTGIDVSHHNGTIDWEKVKDSGVDFVIIRCGYGKDEKGQDDKQWSRNVSECERLGIPFGVYLYSYAKDTQSAQSEAQHVLRLINGHRLTYPVYYDMEDDSTLGSDFASIATTFCNAMKNAGYPVGVYASLSWWNNYLTDSCFEGWYRWVAQYNNSCQYKGNYAMWQYTSKGSVSGITTDVDMNYLIGYPSDHGTPSGISVPDETKDMITYSAHVSDIGWMNAVSNGLIAGTVGQNGKLEALKLKVDENDNTYNWMWCEHNPRNGRLFWCSLLSTLQKHITPSFMYSEEDWFSSLGISDGYIRVDGAKLKDVLNLDDLGCYIYILPDGSAVARSSWNGNSFIEDKNFDDKYAKALEDNMNGFITVIDIHD